MVSNRPRIVFVRSLNRPDHELKKGKEDVRMDRKRRLHSVSILAITVTVILSMTSMIGWGQEELADEQVLRYAESAGDIGTMTVFSSGQAQDILLYDLIYDRLFEFPENGLPSTGGVAPALIASWEVSDDYSVYTLYVREGVSWHKGYGTVTADDVKFTLDMARDPEQSMIAVNAIFGLIEDVDKLDEYTVQVTLSAPFATWLVDMAANGRSVVCKQYVEETGDAGWLNPIGTGAFEVQEYRPNDRVVLVRNESYWKGAAVLESIEVLFMPSLASREAALIRGEVDAIKGAYDGIWLDRMDDLGFHVDMLGPGISGMLEFNRTIEPLDDWKVRAAIAYAIDRDEIVAAFGEILATAQLSPVPESYMFGIPGYEGIEPYNYDPAKAKALLAAAGFPDGFSLTVYTSERDRYLTQYTIIQEQPKQVGITIDLLVVDHSTYHAKGRANENPIMAYGLLTPSGGTALTMFYLSTGAMGGPTPGFNYGNYVNPLVDEALLSAASLPLAAQEAVYAWVQREIINDVAAYPTVHMRMPNVRATYLDIGGQVEGTLTGAYTFTINTRLLKH